MIVGTTEVAKILNVSSSRVRILLKQGRVEGAYKTGKMWLIPLFGGRPIISKRKRGPAAGWRNPRKPAKTIIHINRHIIDHNYKHSTKDAIITVKRNGTNIYGHEVEIPGGCRIIYSPDRTICGGARVWIETLYQVKVTSFDF